MARYLYSKALLQINTVDAVGIALNTLLAMLHQDRGDTLRLRFIVPQLFILLGRDQECYDFVKWWIVTLRDERYDFHDTARPFLDIRGAHIMEPVDVITNGWAELVLLAAVTLLKIRYLHERFRYAANRLTGIVGELVEGNRVDVAKIQARQMIGAVHDRNGHFWYLLFGPTSEWDDGSIGNFELGSREDACVNMPLVYKAWPETPDARETAAMLIEEMMEVMVDNG